MALKFKAQIMDEEAIGRTLVRIAHQIIEKNHGSENLCLIGILRRGAPLARRLAENIYKIENVRVPVGELDITMHRDDLLKKDGAPVINGSDIPFSVEGKIVVLVDDVVYTCRTARAALDAIMELGRPSKIQFFAMVDRGHAELPIKANYVGKNIPTSRSEVISLKIEEIDGETSVSIWERE